jgi:hypothetical protein
MRKIFKKINFKITLLLIIIILLLSYGILKNDGDNNCPCNTIDKNKCYNVPCPLY